jgi:hypothetical protein
MSGEIMHLNLAVICAACIGAIIVTLPNTADATLIMEPVINFVPGSGPNQTTVPIDNPAFLNGATGLPFITASKPGEIDTYSAGYPRDEALTVISFYNNTDYNITGLILNIIGTSTEPVTYTFTITRDPNVDAFFGDANGDGMTGLSDIFSTITVSNNGRMIMLSDGIIPVGGRFSDAIFSYTTDGLPFKAGVDASFDGVLVPEPSSWALLLSALIAFWPEILRRRRVGR